MVFLGLEGWVKGVLCWGWAFISDAESKITAEEVVGTHLCRILDSVSLLPRAEASSARSTNLPGAPHQVVECRKPQKLYTYFHWYARVMLLILRNFKVKIMSFLFFVIFVFYVPSCPPSSFTLYGSGKAKRRSKEEARTFLLPAMKGDDTVSLQGH